MTQPIKRLRSTLYSIHPLSYRIRKITVDKPTMEKMLFKKIILQLRKIDERRDFMQEEIGMDMTTYEDQFFSVIENLMKMHFNKEQLALIQTYLYQLVPDKEWDGSITLEKDKKEQVVPFKSADDVWNVIQNFHGK